MARHGRPTVKMLQNSLFLMASAGLTAGIGFVFWALVAHLYSAERIGLATSLLSAISLISYLSLFGFNATLIRFPARGEARNSQISVSLAAVTITSCLLGAGYLAGLGLFGPQLEFIRSSPLWSVAFIAICAFAAVNLLTDSVFIGARIPQYNTLVDGIIQSLAKLAMPVFLVALGAVGIVAATGVGYAVAVIASFVFMYRKVSFRFDFRTRGTRLREQAKYSAASYVSALLNLAPLLVLPSIVLRALGPAQAAYYFLAFQIATLLTAVTHAIGDNLFAEGSHDPAKTAELLRRAAKIMAAVIVPASVALAALRVPILSLFGSQYVAHGQGILTILSLGSIAVAFNTWKSNALRILGQMRRLVISNVIYSVVIVGFAVVSAHRGLDWIGYGWVAGNFLSSLVVASVPRHAAEAELESHLPDPADLEETVRLPRIKLRPQQPAWEAGFGDTLTEPMYFPWNRPDTSRVASLSAPPEPRWRPRHEPPAPNRWNPNTTNAPRYAPPEGQPPPYRRAADDGMRVRPRTDAADPYRPEPRNPRPMASAPQARRESEPGAHDEDPEVHRSRIRSGRGREIGTPGQRGA